MISEPALQNRNRKPDPGLVSGSRVRTDENPAQCERDKNFSLLPLGEGPGMRACERNLFFLFSVLASGIQRQNISGVDAAVSPHSNPLPEGEGEESASSILDHAEGVRFNGRGQRPRITG